MAGAALRRDVLPPTALATKKKPFPPVDQLKLHAIPHRVTRSEREIDPPRHTSSPRCGRDGTFLSWKRKKFNKARTIEYERLKPPGDRFHWVSFILQSTRIQQRHGPRFPSRPCEKYWSTGVIWELVRDCSGWLHSFMVNGAWWLSGMRLKLGLAFAYPCPFKEPKQTRTTLIHLNLSQRVEEERKSKSGAWGETLNISS